MFATQHTDGTSARVGAPKPTMLPSDFNMWNSLQNAFPR
jgi:hypothetical protein